MKKEIINQILKEAMPWVKLRKGKAIDLFFELMSPEDKKAFFSDLQKGHKIYLPNFGKIEGKPISNPIKTFSEDDLTQKDQEWIKQFINQQSGKPILKYDKIKHKFYLKEK